MTNNHPREPVEMAVAVNDGRMQTSKQTFPCMKCKRCYRKKSSLVRHIKRKHDQHSNGQVRSVPQADKQPMNMIIRRSYTMHQRREANKCLKRFTELIHLETRLGKTHCYLCNRFKRHVKLMLEEEEELAAYNCPTIKTDDDLIDV